MLFNYIKIALRSMYRQKLFTTLNLIGLTASIFVCLLAIVVVFNYRQYDRFHTKKDRIYRINSRVSQANRPFYQYVSTPFPLGEAVVAEVPQVEQTVRLIHQNMAGDAKHGKNIQSFEGVFTTQIFFEIFDFPFRYGNQSVALVQPQTVVLEATFAEKLFGNNNPIGEVISVENWGEVTISGVVEIPAHTHFQFDMLMYPPESVVQGLSETWENAWTTYTYILLHEGAHVTDITSFFPEMISRYYSAEQQGRYQFQLQPLLDITPEKEVNGKSMKNTLPASVLWFISALALVVMLFAGFNYANLSLARSLRRAKEVGVRKVVGASKRQVFAQLIIEATVFVLIGFVLAFALLQNFIPFVKEFSILKDIAVTFEVPIPLLGWFLLFVLTVGVVSGYMPAWYLSQFNPTASLKNLKNVQAGSGFWGTRLTLRKMLMVVQFSISLLLIISVLLLYQQVNLMLHQEYGFNRSQMVSVTIKDAPYEAFRDEALRSVASIERVSANSHLPGTRESHGTIFRRTLDDENQRVYWYAADQHYLSLLEIPLVAGENLSYSTQFEETPHVILNETAIEALGFQSAQEAIGATIFLQDTLPTVVKGVVPDYHFKPMFVKMMPMAILPMPDKFTQLTFKVAPNRMAETLTQLKAIWRKYDDTHVFTYHFFEDELAESYALFNDAMYIIGFVAVLAIVIACLGLLGMATYTISTRLKEIGIRKVIGASVVHIVLLVSRSFIWLLGIAIMLAVPLSYVLNQLWLQRMAVRVGLGVANIGLGVGLILGLGLLIVGIQAMHAALQRPVEVLYDE